MGKPIWEVPVLIDVGGGCAVLATGERGVPRLAFRSRDPMGRRAKLGELFGRCLGRALRDGHEPEWSPKPRGTR